MEEAVAAVDAAGREALSELCSWILGAPATAVALAGLRAMGPLRPLLLPLPTPLELVTRSPLAPLGAGRTAGTPALTRGCYSSIPVLHPSLPYRSRLHVL